MKEIIVMGSPLFLSHGILRLTDAQHRVRAHCVKPYLRNGKPVEGLYEIVSETCFKVGETIGYSGDTQNLRPDIALAIDKDAVIKEQAAKIAELEAALENIKSSDSVVADSQAELEDLKEKLAGKNSDKSGKKHE